MLNGIWVLMIVGAVVCGAMTNNLPEVTAASMESAKGAVTLAIGLVGVMAFWLGLMRILQEGGLLRMVALAMRPVMRRIFPDVPADHPAMSMMILNMTSNMLGLGNAATPFGLKAMMELDKLNPHKGTASNAMALFLAINTSNIALLPTGIIALRASLGASNPESIISTTILATALSTLVAIVSATMLSRLPVFAVTPSGGEDAQATDAVNSAGDTTNAASIDTSEAESLIMQERPKAPRRTRVFAGVLASCVALAFGYAFFKKMAAHEALTHENWQLAGVGQALWDTLKSASGEFLLLALICGIILFGVMRGVKVYDAVVAGGKEGFDVALRIIPFLVAILVAVGMLRASGAIQIMVDGLQPLTSLIGMPAQVLPMALLRPLSGSGAYGVATDIMQTEGPDSLVGQIVSTMQGSTETTFYVIALYYGVVAIKNTRHTLPACLIADTAGVLASVWLCLLILG